MTAKKRNTMAGRPAGETARSGSGLRSEWVAVLFVVVILALIRIPLRFDWFGEQDQARFLVDSILYRYEGSTIVRTYFIISSPLCLAVFALLAKIFGNAALVSVANNVGLAASILTAVAVYALSRTLAASRLWSASIALASGLVPGVFMTSLYGYPSIYALPFGIAAAAAVSHAVTRRTFRAQAPWFALACIGYTLLVMTKADFALFGSVLLAPVIIHRKLSYRNVLMLGAIAVVAVLAELVLVGVMLPKWSAAIAFGSGWSSKQKPFATFNTNLSTLWLAVGIGTLLLLVAGFVATFVREGVRTGARWVAAWLVAVLPIWAFWASVPPISTRHAVPGALLTAIVLGLLAARLFPRRRLAAVAFPVLLLATNWPWGHPGYDLNYDLGGNLIESYRVNRRAFRACRLVAQRMAVSTRPVQIFVGRAASPGILGQVDIIPMVRYELAIRAIEVRNQIQPHQHYNLQTLQADGTVHLFIPCLETKLLDVLAGIPFKAKDIVVDSVAIAQYPQVTALGIEFRPFDLQGTYDNMR
jgi:hypothetical protein